MILLSQVNAHGKAMHIDLRCAVDDGRSTYGGTEVPRASFARSFRPGLEP